MTPRRDALDGLLRETLGEVFFDNFTDLSSERYFTYFIGTDGTDHALGTRGLHAFLAEGKIAYYVNLRISFLAPLMHIRFYRYIGSGTHLEVSYEPYTAMQERIAQMLMQMAGEKGLRFWRRPMQKRASHRYQIPFEE